MLDGPFPIRWEEDTPAGMQAAENHCNYCRRNYVGRFSVKKLLDKDTLGAVEKLTSNFDMVSAARHLKIC